MKLGIKLEFSAAHALPGYRGACSKIHGHTYTLELEVEGPLNPETNFVIDYLELKRIAAEIISQLDHCYLNQLVDFPSCERVAQLIWRKLSAQLEKPGYPKLSRLRLWEGPDCWVELGSTE